MARVQASSVLIHVDVAEEILRLGQPDPEMDDPENAWGDLFRHLDWMQAHFGDEAQSVESKQAYLRLVSLLHLAKQKHPQAQPLQKLQLPNPEALAQKLALWPPTSA